MEGKTRKLTAAANKKIMENTRSHAISVWKQWALECLLGLEPLCITILLIFVSKMLIRFQGQWMGVGISGSSFSKAVCIYEVKTCSRRSSFHGIDSKGTWWQWYLPALHLPHAKAIYPSTACFYTLLQSHEPTHTTLLGHFAREMSQQPARRRKSAGKGGHQT